jgi:hypothetical protein
MPPRPVDQRPYRQRRELVGGPGTFLTLSVVLVISTGLALAYIGWDEERFGTIRPAVALPLLLLVGVGSLLILITGITAVLDRYGLTDREHAFGLPDGTMQAIIAISLVLIFVIASLYLYSSLPTGAIEAADAEAAQNRREFAQQLLTTVGTLAVAVAGFYFGTRSVTSARAAVAPSPGAAPAPRLRWPTSPFPLEKTQGAVLEPILVDVPPGRRVAASVASGDQPGQVQEVAPGEFRYIRGAAPADRVVIAFTVAGGTEREELVVEGK